MNKQDNTPRDRGLKSWLLSTWRTWAIIASFAVIAFAYFSPAVIDGRDLFQNDVAGASGTAQDVRDFMAATGETSYWTNSLFGGMPMYQISPSYPSLGAMKMIQDILTLQTPFKLLPSYSWLLFAMLVGFFIFMRSLKLSRGIALLGALMWTFSSYFIILIEAGHIWKLMVLSFIPPTIAGIIYTYEGKYLKGGIITAFFASLQLMSNHVQMSYYFAFVIAFVILSYLYTAIKTRDYRGFLLSTLSVAIAAVISISINISNIYHTYQYTQETMRGGSALSEPTEQGVTKGGGLDKEYITAWSYGKAETFTFLVPNLYGGATGALADNSQALEVVKSDETKQILASMNHYWGDQPFTSGPVYVGAFVLFMAILACFIVRTPLKWALLAATILSLLLGWGHNLMWVSDLFIDYFPLYNKFRTVSSILVIAEFTIPTLAVLALVKFLEKPDEVLRERVALSVSFGATLGVAFLFALTPSLFFDFLSQQEQEMFKQYLADPRALEVISALKDVRAGIVSADAWRSVGIIVVSLSVCYLYTRKAISRQWLLGLIVAITFFDLWTVDKRYLNDEKFIDTSLIQAQANPVSDADLKIKQDVDKHYRVLNLSVSPFNDATTSFSHRSIGGYHAAKLGRYQDLIEKQISQGNKQVMNMLDTRYIITRDPHGSLYAQQNHDAMGAAWLVAYDQLLVVSTADEEMAALGDSVLDLRYQAVLHQDQGIKGDSPYKVDSIVSLGSVKLVDYQPNLVKYEVEAKQDALLVMSEVYYPHGWTLTIDGKPADIKRANYLLRATEVKQGKHILVMTFDPQSVHITELISYIAQVILALAVIACVVLSIRQNKNQE